MQQYESQNFSCLTNVRSSHRDSFRKYLLFFSRSNLFIIFQEGPSVRRKDMFFQGGSICSSNKPYYLIEQILILIPINPYLVLKHIQIFQEPLFSHRTDTHFPGSPI